MPERLRTDFAECQCIEGPPAQENQYGAGGDHRRGEAQIVEASIGKRAEHPAHDFACGPRTGRQRQHQGNTGYGERAENDAREHERERARRQAREQEQREHAEHRAGDAAQRQYRRMQAGDAEENTQYRAERRHRRNAERAGVGERIAQIALQRRAGETERSADHDAEQGARQPHSSRIVRPMTS